MDSCKKKPQGAKSKNFQKFTVNIPFDVYLNAKDYAYHNGITVKDIILNGLKKELETRAKKR